MQCNLLENIFLPDIKMIFINKKSVLDFEYAATFKDKIVYIYARTIFSARQKAVEHFRLKKKEIENLTIKEIES